MLNEVFNFGVVLFIFFIHSISIGFGVHDVLRSCLPKENEPKERELLRGVFHCFSTMKTGTVTLNLYHII